MTSAAGAKDLAWKLIEFATGPEAQLVSAQNANAPTRGSLSGDAKVQGCGPGRDRTTTQDTGPPSA